MSPIAMTLVLLTTLGFFSWSAKRRIRQLKVGVPDPDFDLSRPGELFDRTKTLMIFAFFQKKMPNYTLAGLAHVGIFMAFRTYLQQPQLATSLRERFAGLHRTLENKYWVDEFYAATVVKPIHEGSVRLWRFWDEKIVDGTVNGVGYFVEGCSAVLRLFQTGYVGTYALFVTLGVLALLLHFLRS